MKGIAYRMRNTGDSSAKFGPCEICGKSTETTYLLSAMQRYVLTSGERKGKDILPHLWTIFGHKYCLAAITENV